MGFGIRRAMLATATVGGLTLAFAASASAHVAAAPVRGFAAGVAHPLAGIDHVLAMVAVGLWAAAQGGRAVWALPASFVTVMVVGGALGSAGVAMPMAEQGIALSVLVAGVLLAAAVRLPVTLGMALTGVFALFHGHAHGIAMSAYMPAGSFAAGFVLATIVLHALGIALATALQRDPALRGSPALQMLGLVLVVAGLGLVSR